MRQSLSAIPSRVFTLAVVAALCGIAASCSSGLLGGKEMFTASTPNQRIIMGDAADQPIPAPTTSVTRADLPPPPDNNAVAMTSPATTALPAPTFVSTQPTNSDAYAWSAVGGTVITVASGDTLDTLAAKYGVPQNQILNSNQLASAGQVTAGRVIVIPHRVPVTPGTPVPASMTTTQVAYIPAGAVPPPAPSKTIPPTYTVLTGDTLFSISQKTGVTPDAIIAMNNLGTTSQLKTGTVLKLNTAVTAPATSAAATTTPSITTTTVAAAASAMPGIPKPTPAPIQVASNGTLPKITTPVVAPTVKPTTTPAVSNTTAKIPATQASLSPSATLDATTDTPSANGTTFRWPVRGRIIASFGTSTSGERNDGINMAVPEGTSVKAAEAGTVIYAGNELEGYGNLILIRHADGWVSAYAHNKDLMVKRGDTVARGQTIAHAGMTGSVTSPQVHFELRKGSSPVNPLDYLTG